QALGVGAHLTRLRRTRIGRLDIAQAAPLDDLLARPALDDRVIPLAAALPLLD
ncbi:MAG TPA: tRNA pseudouridine(55) synthase TruB, partial [Kiritimatiellia bacterium]|nr:tRNA pseudouridine(55) synthase TruB [Kiritimatiellia bacterium]